MLGRVVIVEGFAERVHLGPDGVDGLGVGEDVRMGGLADAEAGDRGLAAQALGVGDGRVQLLLRRRVPVLVELDLLAAAVVTLGRDLGLGDVLVDLIALAAEALHLDAGRVAHVRGRVPLTFAEMVVDLALRLRIVRLVLLHHPRDGADQTVGVVPPLGLLGLGLVGVRRRGMALGALVSVD